MASRQSHHIAPAGSRYAELALLGRGRPRVIAIDGIKAKPPHRASGVTIRRIGLAGKRMTTISASPVHPDHDTRVFYPPVNPDHGTRVFYPDVSGGPCKP